MFYLTYNQYAKKGSEKSAQQLWPLSIDSNFIAKLTTAELYERNKKIIESLE